MIGEIRHALRRLRATPVVTLSAVACLSIGVWMTCIMTAVALGVFRPNLHIPQQDRVVQLDELGLYSTSWNRGPICCGRFTSRSVFDSLSKLPYLTATGYYGSAGSELIEGDATYRRSAALSSGMMKVLRVVPQLGRGFLPVDDTVGGVVMISDHLWRSRYGADSAIIGRRLRLRRDVIARTIVGVMRPDFVFPRSYQRADLYFPVAQRGRVRPAPAVIMLGRLADGVDLGEAEEAARRIATGSIASDRAAMSEWVRSLSKRSQAPVFPSGGVRVRLERYFSEPRPDGMLRLVGLILACGFAVAAVAAANVINLLLVRGVVRRPEIAVRMAMGATRPRVIRELVLEVVLLAVPAVVIGFVAAERQWATLNPAFYARHMLGEIDARVGVIAMLSGLALAALVGIWPALRATGFALDQAMRDSRRVGSTGSALDGILGRLVTAATAATVVLLIAAVLLGLSARDAFRGTVADRTVLSSNLTFDERQPRTERIALARETLNKLRGMPGMAIAALGDAEDQSLLVSTTSEPPAKRLGAVEVNAVSDGFFGTLRIRMLRGRDFTVRETRDSVGKVVLSRLLAGRLFPGRSGIGERFRYRRAEDSTVVEAEVIGVAEDVIQGSTITPRLYISLGSSPVFTTTAYAKYRSEMTPRPKDIMKMLQARTGLTPTTVVSLAERMRYNDPLRDYVRIAFVLFASVGLVLAIIGTYGVVAYSVARRTHEIGVRMALGAEGARVTRMVIEHGLKITLVGIIFGIAVSIGTMKIIGSMVIDVRMGYPAAIGGVIALVCVLSFIASAIPAVRAGRLNPVDALRSD
jgi:putative ABC transport system permease protein